ncbi:MAG: right-handed parallel beta-helix repeat-containing protein, partial [Planctomycetes bacterium]|nr:right-handed parallel beta-helix repeat-containing protein [Planctomycetota bacterium]
MPEISGSLTIIGNGATIQPGPHAPPFRFFTVPFRSELTLVDLSLMGGSRPQGISNVKFYGGAILAMGALTMDQVRIEASSAESGGAVSASGSVTIYDSVIQGNLAGDGVVLIGGSNFLSDTTIANNIGTGCVLAYGQAKFERCAIMGNRFYGGLVVYRASATLTNCTISGNESFGNPFGGAGGAGVSFAGTTNDSLMLDHCTVTDNASIYGAGGVQNEYDDYYSATMKFSHSVIAGQRSGGNCSFHGLAGVPSVSDGYNLDTDGTCGLNQPTDRPNTDPRLGPLADNGGLTMTHALLPGSPAINLIPASQCTVDTDQRGFARPHGGACDVGAFEFACDPATSCSAKGSCNDDDSCVCDSGWTRADCSQDIDECANGTDNCDANATCTNTPGSFACACNDGYLGDGLSCALDTDGDGLPDVKDVCPHSDL